MTNSKPIKCKDLKLNWVKRTNTICTKWTLKGRLTSAVALTKPTTNSPNDSTDNLIYSNNTGFNIFYISCWNPGAREKGKQQRKLTHYRAHPYKGRAARYKTRDCVNIANKDKLNDDSSETKQTGSSYNQE